MVLQITQKSFNICIIYTDINIVLSLYTCISVSRDTTSYLYKVPGSPACLLECWSVHVPTVPVTKSTVKILLPIVFHLGTINATQFQLLLYAVL